jgi:hypothetical protein
VQAAANEIDKVLEATLSAGYMGTGTQFACFTSTKVQILTLEARPEESAMTLGCARERQRALCEVISVSDNHMDTEMPCSMFLRLSATGPQVGGLQLLVYAALSY